MAEEKEIKDERKRWRMKRLEKEIQLIDMAEFVGVSYNMLSLHERAKANLAPERVIRYKQYIDKNSGNEIK